MIWNGDSWHLAPALLSPFFFSSLECGCASCTLFPLIHRDGMEPQRRSMTIIKAQRKKMGGRGQTWPAGIAPNKQDKHPFSPLSLTYGIQRCVPSLSLSLSFLSLCFVVLCCTLTRTPQSPGVCQQRLVLAHIATGTDNNNNADEPLSIRCRKKTGVPTEDYKLMRTLASSPPPFCSL